MNKILYLFLVIPIVFSSCSKEEVSGCTDPQATNYDSSADISDNSCLYNINGVWGVDDYILNGVSLFSTSLDIHITSMAITLNNNGTTWTLAYYSDDSELNVYGTWSLAGTSQLILTNDEGDSTSWTITQLNGSTCELYSSDVGGLGEGTIRLSR